MKINELIAKYLSLGYERKESLDLAAEEILLTKIAKSPLVENVTLKGGIVMYNLSKNRRRITRDIDFDFIRYSIDQESIKTFIRLLNKGEDGVNVEIIGMPQPLKHENYKGVRLHLKLSDVQQSVLIFKFDIGVHTYATIEQSNLSFSFDNQSNISLKVNPPEQVFVEKLLSLIRFGLESTRYKDVYDMFFLIKNNYLDKKRMLQIFDLFFSNSKIGPYSIATLTNDLKDIFEDRNYRSEVTKPSNKWIDVEYEKMIETILSFLESL